jgi:hypothetical protein
VPRLSHQFPVAEVVVVAVVVVILVAVVVEVLVVVGVILVVVLDVDFDVDVLAHDASSIVATSKKLKPSQITLFFIFISILINHKHILSVMANTTKE